MENGLSSETIKAIDEYTINNIGIPSMVLMERAALAITEQLLNSVTDERLAFGIVCGTGNNGGDGLAIGRLLKQSGRTVMLYLVGDTESGSDEYRQQLKIVENLNIPHKIFDASMEDFKEDIIIDALFGIGLNRTIEEPYKKPIQCINKSKGTIAAIDVPSGLSADTGEIYGTAVEADQTYTIGFTKKGFNFLDAQKHTGEIHIVSIGYPELNLLEDILKKEETND